MYKKAWCTRGTQRRFPPKYIENTSSAIQSTHWSLEMHSKSGTMKFVYLFGHPGETWVFSKLQEIQYYFAKNFRCNLTYYEGENFSYSSFHHIFESENFRFPFATKNSPTWGVKCRPHYTLFSYTPICHASPPANSKARRGGRRGKVTAVITDNIVKWLHKLRG